MTIKTHFFLIIFILYNWMPAITFAQEYMRLSVSQSGHYINYNGKTLLLSGDSGTQCVMQNAAIDYRRWIDDCSRTGINCVHIWSFMAPRQKADGSVIEARYGYYYPGISPWARKTSGPRAHDGDYQWDLNKWDEGDDLSHYWPRLRDLCAYAKEKGIIVGITVFWGWPKHPKDWQWHPFNHINGGPVTEEITLHATKVQHIANPGEPVFQNKWQDDWSESYKNQWYWERFADKLLQETNHYGNVFYVFMDEHSYDEGNGGDHFREMFQNRGAFWVDWEPRRKNVDAVFAPLNYSESKGRNRSGVDAFNKYPVRPFMMLEGEPYTGDNVRYATWTLLIAGGHNIFHNDESQETPQTGIMGYDPHVPGGDTGMQRRIWLGNAGRFFNEMIHDLDSMAPDNSIVSEGSFCLANPQEEYCLYSLPSESRTLKIDLSDAKGKYTYYFYNPRTGEKYDEMTIDAGKWVEMSKPTTEDWVIHIIRIQS